MPKKLLFLILLSGLLLLGWVSPAWAQQPPAELDSPVDWAELKTDKFVIVYAERVDGLSILTCACGIEEAEFYANFIDDVYQDLVTIFNVELDTPINLRLFPTEEAYYEVNPIAERIPGVIAHALNNRAEIAIALPRTRGLSEEELINNLRHELSHFFASYLSDGNLTTGFQEGTAQYLEKPTETAEYDPTVLRQALEQRRLLSWAHMDEARQVWRDPQVAYPQALSMTAFLVDRYGLPAYLKFIQANATEPGFRSALEAAYGKSADVLEEEWLAYLPEYFAGRWQINAIYAYDLTRVAELVAKGAYTDAETELTDVVELLASTAQLDTLTQAETLLTQARQGRAAGALADDARQAFEGHNYPRAIEQANASLAAYEELGYRERVPELQIYIQRAEIGLTALTQLQRGAQLLDTFQFFEAERQIREATVMLQTLGHQQAAQQGEALLAEVTDRQSWLAYAMIAVGLLLAAANGVRRLAFKFSANPLEVEYS